MNAPVYELTARERKAKTIVDWVRQYRPDVDADIAALMDGNGRRIIAQLAQVNVPSDATWEIVVSELRRPVRPLRVVPSDPFSGLPGAS